jgi:hydroxysqualene synthase
VIRRVTESLPSSSPRPSPPKAGPGRRLDAGACFEYCESFVRAHHENFPVASLFLPAPLRPHVCALYAFARHADDFADEPEYEGRREAELDHWEDQLLACFHGEAEHPVFIALSETVARFELPIAPFSDMLQAFRMDLVNRTYATFADLLSYVHRAAHPIGRLILYTFGVRDAERLGYGDDLAAALALTSFWQDGRRDLARGRVYFPQEDLRHFALTEADLRDAYDGRPQARGVAPLARFQVARTRAFFERSRPLLDLVPRELAVELGLFWHGGRRALDKVEAQAADLGAPRVRLTVVDKAVALGRAVLKI